MSMLAATTLVGSEEDERVGCGDDLQETRASNSQSQTRAMRAIACDSQEIIGRVASSAIPAGEATALQDRTRDLSQRARAALSTAAPISSRLPLSAEHQQMYEIAAAAERAAGSPPLLAWAANPWAPLDPLDRPADRSERQLSTALMRGERRALAQRA